MKDVKEIREDKHVFVKADDTTNSYKTSKEDRAYVGQRARLETGSERTRDWFRENRIAHGRKQFL